MRNSSIFPDHRTFLRRRLLVAGLAFGCLLETGRALDPARTLTQYVHSHWGKEKGFAGGTVYAISQSADGYLWIGTDRGLVRFDGEKFTLIQHPLEDQPAMGPVRGLVEDSDGNLWIRPQGSGLLAYRDGRFRAAPLPSGPPAAIITASARGGQGDVLFSELISRLVRFTQGRFETVADSTDSAGTITSLAETRDGRVWLGTRDGGLLVIKDGKPVPATSPDLENEKINALAATRSGGLWIGTDHGLEFRSMPEDIRVAAPAWIKSTEILDLTEDVSGNVWAASSRGLVRITPDGSFSLFAADGKKTGPVTAVYEDRSGSIWFGGPEGLERLEDGLFATYSSRDGLPPSNGGALYVDHARRTWFAPVSGGLYFLDNGRVHQMHTQGLDHDVVYSISGQGDEIWAGRQDGGLTRITANENALPARTYTRADGLAQNTVFATYAARDGGVWAGTISGGLSHLSNGVFTNYSMSNGLSSNAVNSIIEGHDGTIWVGTSAGLDAYRAGAWSHWTRASGLPASEVRNCYEDSQHILWLLTASGLAYLSSGRVMVPSHLPEPLHDQLFGITEDGLGFLWLSTTDHVIRVNRDRLLADAVRDSDIEVMGEPEGLSGAQGVRRDRSILSAPGGRIWVSVQNGVASTDPALSLRELQPVAVRIESIAARGAFYHAGDSLRIPPRTRSLTFRFSGATLDAPDRIWYRYLLEGADQAWSDPVQMRQVSYNNLHAGPYRFRVMASTDGMLWNGPEGDATFSIDQAAWETWWFRTGALLLAALIVFSAFRLRMLRLSQQLNARFQDRLAERTRIAQELHDTLLQSFQGLMLRFQTVGRMLPARPEEAKAMLDDALDRADDALTESREAIQNIRSFPGQNARLTQTLASVVEQVRNEFSQEEQREPSCSIVVEGTEKVLRDSVTAEISRIAREALRNVFQHAAASQLEIEISFRDSELRLSLRDDGVGVEPAVLREGSRTGHWGLTGMRERALRLGAELNFWSKPGAGTEIALSIPGNRAYSASVPNAAPRNHPRMKT